MAYYLTSSAASRTKAQLAFAAAPKNWSVLRKKVSRFQTPAKSRYLTLTRLVKFAICITAYDRQSYDIIYISTREYIRATFDTLCLLHSEAGAVVVIEVVEEVEDEEEALELQEEVALEEV